MMNNMEESTTSEIWVTSLGILKHENLKTDSEKLMIHYSKLSEIFTKF